jgi:MFS family permease
MNRNLWLLAVLQGLFLTNNVTFIAINGLVGFSLAPYGWLATLPVMGYVVGGALCTGPVAWTQKRFGRKISFMFGLVVAVVSALLCAFAIYIQNFWLLCIGTMVAGYYSANGQLYRFASAELARPEAREKAVSMVMAGGLLGAVLGPNLASYAKDWVLTPFVGAYLALVGVALVAILLLTRIKFPERPAGQSLSGGRPLSVIARQPAFIVATGVGALSYGIMNLLMAATPLAMHTHGMPFEDAAFVLEWHVIGMFAPGFFSGSLIKRWGVLPVMAGGAFLNLICIVVALSGTDLHYFTLSSFLLGVGWNFLFVGATTLSLSTYSPEERDRAQGVMNFCVFAVMAVTSLTSGMLVTTQGWSILNIGSLVPVLVIFMGLGWLGLSTKRKRLQAAMSD